MKNNKEIERVFLKSIRLLETRLGVKIKKASLIAETNLGDFSIHLKDDVQTFQMLLRYINIILNDFVTVQYASSQVTCSQCLGIGEFLDNSNFIITCPKCKGGGIMIITTLAGQNDHQNKEG